MAVSDDRRNRRHRRTYLMQPNSRQVRWAIRGGTVLLRATMYSPCMMPAAEYLVLAHLKVTLNSAAYFSAERRLKHGRVTKRMVRALGRYYLCTAACKICFLFFFFFNKVDSPGLEEYKG